MSTTQLRPAAGRRVRELAREMVAVMAFSAVASAALAGAETIGTTELKPEQEMDQ